MSQEYEILRVLNSGGTLTAMDALRQFNCFRLAARVKDLRYRGYDIRTEMVGLGNKSIAKYYLPQ